MATIGTSDTPMTAATAPGATPRFARVNLLPERTRMRLMERRRGATWMFANAVVALAALLVWQWSRGVLNDIANERTQLNEQQGRVEREERIGAGLASRAATLQGQIGTLNALRPAEHWSQRLAQLAQAVPGNTMLTHVNVLPAAAPPTPAAAPPGRRARGAPQPATPPAPEVPRVTISGFAADHACLAELLRRLTHEAAFAGVRLVRSDVLTQPGSPLVQFEISATR